ncbi:hypothetical protein FQZ97_1087270 [compost metagenome]
MGGPDAAGGEHIGVAGPQRIDGIDDIVGFVAHHPHFPQLDAEVGAKIGGSADIDVLGAAREDLVANNQQSGGDGVCRHDCIPWRCWLPAMPPRDIAVKQSCNPSNRPAKRLFCNQLPGVLHDHVR